MFPLLKKIIHTHLTGTHTHINTLTQRYTCTLMYSHTYMHTPILTHTLTHTYACSLKYTHIHMLTDMCTHTYTFTHILAYTYIHMCTQVFMPTILIKCISHF